jgi:hypothetical protein
MVKDRIGNVLEAGDKVLVFLPDKSIIGFISEVKEPSNLLQASHVDMSPGRVLVSCVIALPVDAQFGATAQALKLHDAAKDEKAAAEGSKAIDKALREVSKAN